ncbi:phosphoribosylformylglycinamidine synthase subunit PurQ [Thermosulfurimonas marina]|uniref:Phosphoribosylformylglycinamidine synthase subunit PurQ n=1 Tax=Thermosulfurimonas marina TaxID=2047767 RepID=A0A6H1WUH2_9BACT|nr:phosphoribosylformylglycinamidine synthase subunit PurQ [Thermosulfurimonas marina]QJA06853.1 phosphoribosylformylglycinamidine synthase subunit PurQ [Thermosulfurimonas marina]
MKPRALVLSGYGINCERETAHTLRLAGAEAEIVHFSELLYGEKHLRDYHLLCFPGGFLDGDHLGAAQAAAHRLRHARVVGSGERLLDQILEFIEAGKLVIGICNGFQLLVKLGLLPALGGRYGERRVSLTYNDSGRFEDRWVWLRVNPDSPCVFTRGLSGLLYFPVRHGEGKFVAQDEDVLRELFRKGQIVLQYAHPQTGRPTQEYPFNPNGSVEAVAGICDPTGRIFGLMPHPEAFNHFTNHPRWTREQLPPETPGLKLFKNAVAYLRETLLS